MEPNTLSTYAQRLAHAKLPQDTGLRCTAQMSKMRDGPREAWDSRTAEKKIATVKARSPVYGCVTSHASQSSTFTLDLREGRPRVDQLGEGWAGRIVKSMCDIDSLSPCQLSGWKVSRRVKES